MKNTYLRYPCISLCIRVNPAKFILLTVSDLLTQVTGCQCDFHKNQNALVLY